jgi:8-oxo-dGTP pyrophosphatase MutT (NUDIX family)
MRLRAGIVLIQDNKVALIERYRAGLHYFTFPGGGVDPGELLEQAAIREAMEELGIEVVIKQEVAEVRFGQRSRQIYFLVEQVGGEFGTGQGEEFAPGNAENPQRGMYIPTWMPITELPGHNNVYAADVARLVVRSLEEGWQPEPVVCYEEPR